MAEIEDAELSRLRGAELLLTQLRGNKKTRRPVEAAIKEIHPDFSPTPPEPEETLAEAKAAAKSVLDEHLKSMKNEKLEEDFQNKLKSYRLSKDNPDGYTDEGIEKIMGLMKERTIPDVDAAVALFEKMNPAKPEPPSGYTPTGWNFGSRDKDDEDKKMLFEDPDAWSDREAAKVWNEMKTQTTS